ncbi:DDE-type integrase/transposase/recombinase [Paenibacillus sp. 2RAB27]
MRWAHEFGPEIDKRICPYLRPTNVSYRTDETYIKVNGNIYRAVDSTRKTIDFMKSENRDMPAAKSFFTKAFASPHNQLPREISLGKNPAYPTAIQE